MSTARTTKTRTTKTPATITVEDVDPTVGTIDAVEDEPESPTITVVVDGVTVTIDRDVKNDFELGLWLDLLGNDDSNGELVLRVIVRILGQEQALTALASLRGDNGRVDITRGSQFVANLVRAAFSPNS